MRFVRLAAIGIMLCLLLGFPAYAQGMLTGPEAALVGERVTLTLSFPAEEYSQIQGTLSFDHHQLQFLSAKGTQGWEVTWLEKSFTLHPLDDTAGEAGLVLSFRVLNLPPETHMQVLCAGVTAWKQGRAISLGDISCSITVASPLSTDNSLTMLSLESGELTPVFHPDITSYTAVVPHECQQLRIQAVGAEKAQVQIQDPGFNKQGVDRVTITVTAENGSQRIYTLRVIRSAPTQPTDPAQDGSGQSDVNRGQNVPVCVAIAAVLTGAALGGAGAIFLENKTRKGS